jgi:NitT/TauT family transport system substrate-binding protein
MLKSYKIGMLILFIVGVVFIVFLAKQKIRFQESRTIRVGVMDWPGFYPAVAASAANAFEAEGIRVELVLAKDNPALNSLLETGNVDAAFGSLADHILMSARAKDITVIAIADYSFADTIVGKPEINSLKDLSQKKIGIGEINSFSEFFILKMLSFVGVDEKLIQFELIPFYEVSQSLNDKVIDAGHTWEPELSKALKDGFKILASSKERPGVVTDSFAVRNDYLRNRITLKKFIKIFFKFADGMQNNFEPHSAAIAKYFSIEEKDGKAFFTEGVDLLSLDENVQALKTSFEGGEDFRSAEFFVKEISEFYHSRGQIEEPIELKSVVDSSFVTELKEELAQ